VGNAKKKLTLKNIYMKISIILISLFTMVLTSCGQDNNNKTRIYDNEDILTINQELSLDSIISDFEKRTTNEILIVTSKDIGEYEEPILFAADFGNNYGIGKKGKDNGLVIFFSKTLRKTSLATGYGTEKILKDEICKTIIDSCMIPLFKQEKYFEGIKTGVEESIRNWK
jgi:uncharacterized protein